MKTLAIAILFYVETSCSALQPISTWNARQVNGVPASFVSSSAASMSSSRAWQLHMSNDDDEDDDDDEYIEDSDLGDWRSFRKTLVDSGISYETAQEGYLDPDEETTKEA